MKSVKLTVTCETAAENSPLRHGYRQYRRGTSEKVAENAALGTDFGVLSTAS